MEEFSVVLPAAATQINKCKCACGPCCSTQQVTSHSSWLGTQASPHQWNTHLWVPSRALLSATAPAAEGKAKLAPAVETAPRGCYPCSARSHPVLLFYPKSLHSRFVSSYVHGSTHPCFQCSPFKETSANCFKKYKLRQCSTEFWMLSYFLEQLLE